VLAINILARFLMNRENNVRYVALKSLSTVVDHDF
jgi:AP-1 complex subunit gamma-1